MNRREKSVKRMKKRTVLGRRLSATPVPRWNQALFSNNYQLYEEAGITPATPAATPSPSARKLAASLWELQDLPLPACLPACLYSPNWIPYNSSPPGATPPSDVNASPFSQPDYVLSPTANHRYWKTGANRGVQAHLQRLLTKTGVEPGNNVSAHAPTLTGANRGVQTHLQRLLTKTGDVSAHAPTLVDRQRQIPWKGEVVDSRQNGRCTTTTTSQELLKVFSQIRMLEEQHTSSLNLTAALHSQLLQAHARVRELELPHRIARREEERFSEEKKRWKVKEKERVKAAVQPVKEELEEERKEKQRLDSANRRLTKELTEAQTAAANERKARQLMEEVCNQLAQERGNNKAEVEEMKRREEHVREALEEERRMLQLAEVWREERVQMKLGEARLALEAKSAALDAMRAELESFLKRGKTYDVATFRDAQALHNALSTVHRDTSISTFPPTSSMSSASTFSFPPSSEYMYHPATRDTDSSQGTRSHGQALLFYPQDVPDAD